MASTATPQYLYTLDEDLYRFGNAATSKLDKVRLHRAEVTTYDRNGVLIASDMKGSFIWKIPPNFPMPPGLALFPDTDRLKPGEPPEHYFLCPQPDMPSSEYVGLLAKMALHFERIQIL